MPIPVRCAAGAAGPRRRGAGPPGGGRGITWGGTGRDIPARYRRPCCPSARRSDAGRSPDGPRAPRYALAPMTSPADLQAQADALHWYHTIDLGNGVVTKGDSAQDDGTGILPDVTGPQRARHRGLGRQVLVPGRAGRAPPGSSRSTTTRGASTSPPGAPTGPSASRAACSPTSPATRRTSGSPTCRGGAGSNWPRRRWGRRSSRWWPTSRRSTSTRSGQFDVVLYLGVLYHMKEPLTCLERVRAVTKEVAVIETEAVHLQGSTTRRCCSSTPAARCAPTSATGTCRRSRRCTTCAGRRASPRCAPSSGRRPPPPHARAVAAGQDRAAARRHRRRPAPRRRPPTTAPSSTPSPDRSGATRVRGPRLPAGVRGVRQSFSTV